MLHMILGGAGCGKSEYLIQKIADMTKENIRIRTMVPEPFSYTYDKRLYAHLGAAPFNRIVTGSFRSLTAEVLEHVAAESRDAADAVIKTVVLHNLMQNYAQNHVLQYYGRQTEKPSFLADMTKQLTELMQSGTEPEQLLQASADISGNESLLASKLSDIARIYADYLAALNARGLHDSLRDPITAAAAADASAYLKNSVIFMDEFESFTGDQYAMIEIMLRDADDIWIALRSDNIDAPDYTRFDAVNDTARRLRRIAKEQGVPCETILLKEQHRFKDASLAHLSKYLFAVSSEAYQGESAVTVCEARDMTAEAEYCAAQIRQLLMAGTYRAGDIMIVMHDIAEYSALLEAALHRYEIPYFMDLSRSVLHTAVMKLPLCLLTLAQRSATDMVLILLKTQLSPLHPNQASDLENFVYTWTVNGAQWDTPFSEEIDPDGIYEPLRQKIMEPILSFRRGLYQNGELVCGAEICSRLYDCMEKMGVPGRIGGLAAHMRDDQRIIEGRALRRLWGRLTELLDALYDALGETRVTLKQMIEIMTAVMRNNQIPVPPQTLDAVTVQSAAAARYDAPKAVFVLGVTEGKFPADIHSGGFFSEAERNLLKAHKVELSRSVRDLCADERLIVYKTLSAPSEHLWLCYPLANEKGSSLVPSSLIEDVRRLIPMAFLPGAFHYSDRMGAKFYISTIRAAYYSFTDDYTLSPTEKQSVRQMLEQNDKEKERLKRLAGHTDVSRLRVTDTNLLKRLIGNQLSMSASRIEDTIKCPFMGFAKHGLRLYERERKDLNALSVGNMVHHCMEQLFLKHPKKEDFLALTKDELHAHAVSCAEDFLHTQLGGEDHKPHRFMMRYQRTVSRMDTLLQHTQEEMRQSRFVPDTCELVIGRVGKDTGTAPYTLTLQDGTILYLNGKIDRVDITEQDGQQYIRIVDYKTGKKKFNLADVYYGLSLQMLLYLFAVMDDPTHYADAEAAGVLYMPAGSPGMQERDKVISEETYFHDFYRMSGTVLKDRGILSKMEEHIAGVYIPAACINPDAENEEMKMSKDSQVFTKEQLGRLRIYIEDLVRECAACYISGDVAPSPMCGSQKNYYADACAYCNYSTACGIADAQTDVFRKPLKEAEAKAQMMDIMNGIPQKEETEDESMDS
ncbi:MAG: PD-(D/E)XK nuclease family protein [Oscillospiraceae bacterium]|nr:PD-(D/E)XK nuclease family protein [Oscillospiraceae bacterium]